MDLDSLRGTFKAAAAAALVKFILGPLMEAARDGEPLAQRALEPWVEGLDMQDLVGKSSAPSREP